MELKNQLTSLGISKQLEEAGYPQDGLYWWVHPWQKNPLKYYKYVENKFQWIITDKLKGRKGYTAASLAELGEHFKNVRQSSGISKRFPKYACVIDGIPDDYHIETSKSNEANTRAKQWLYAKKEGLLK